MEPICHNCAHYFINTGSGLMDPELETCAAFYPAAIPEEIIAGEVGHSEPHPQQQNKDILFLSMSPMKKPGS